MKVYDIISEISPEEIARRKEVMRRNMATQKAATAQQQQRQQTSAQSQARRAQADQMRQQAGQPFKTAAGQAASKAKATASNFTWAEVKKKMASLKKKKQVDNKVKNRAAKKMLQISGFTKRLLSWVGFAVVMKDYYNDMALIDEMVEHYNQTGDAEAGLPPEYYPMAVRLLRLETITTIVASAGLVKLISYLLGTATGLKWMIRVVGTVSSTVTLGASIAGILASEAATIAFRTFLMTEQGKEAIAWFVLKVIDPAVNTAGVADLLNGEIKKAADVANQGNKPTAAQPATQNAPAASAPAPQQSTKPASGPAPGQPGYVNPGAAGLMNLLQP